MPYERQYTKQEVSDILRLSEGRSSPVTTQPGHCMSLHVGQSGLQVSDRLRGEIVSDAQHPIIMGPTGTVLPESQSRNIWRSLGPPGTTTNQLKSAYKNNIDNGVQRSGSFRDAQDALTLARYALNSTTGQAELRRLDTDPTTNRIFITVSVSAIQSLHSAWIMKYADSDNDVTHDEQIKSVFMIVDRYADPASEIHIQTFYPVK